MTNRKYSPRAIAMYFSLLILGAAFGTAIYVTLQNALAPGEESVLQGDEMTRAEFIEETQDQELYSNAAERAIELEDEQESNSGSEESSTDN